MIFGKIFPGLEVWTPTFFDDLGLSENSVPQKKQWLMIIIPMKNGYNWGYTPFSDIPISQPWTDATWLSLSMLAESFGVDPDEPGGSAVKCLALIDIIAGRNDPKLLPPENVEL